jgi:superfamily II DNA or RNA helicase
MKECKIVISDEVNCKILGLDLSTRKKLVNKFKYQVPYARHLPSVRLGRWDGCVSFAQLGGSTYINLLPEIIPLIEEDGYDIELEDLRTYSNTFEFDLIHEQTFAHKTWPKGHVLEGQPIELRDYQVDGINECLRNLQSLHKLPTGSGKTIITAALSYSVQKYGRSIVIVPNKDLVKQTEVDYINIGLDVGVYFGDRKQWNKTHTICTWQSLNNLLKDSKNGKSELTIKDFIDGVVCVIVDEVHQAKADVLKTLLTDVFAHVPIRWGLTGTIPKEEFEFRSLQVSFGEVVNSLQASDLQEKGVLANLHVNIKQLVDHVEYKEYQSELKYLLENTDRVHYIAQMIVDISKTGNTLVLVDRVAPGKMLTEAIPGAVFLSGATKSDDRKEQYDDYADRNDKISIATYGIAAVGLNIPRIFNLVLIEPGKSFVRVIQSIGRGIRKAEDKDYVEIYDITSTCKFAKRHLTKRKEFYKEARYEFSLEKVEWQ